MITTRAIELNDTQEKELKAEIHHQLSMALDVHKDRKQRYAEYYTAYKARPKTAKKNFPWDGASNVVVPLVPIGVDSISARLQRAIFAAKDIVEIEIKNKEWEHLEKKLRDYFNTYMRTVAQAELRQIFIDMPTYGHAFVKPMWEKKVRNFHSYDQSTNVQTQEVVDFEGVRWHIIHPKDVVYPDGFEHFKELPWWAHHLRYTKGELFRMKANGSITQESYDKLIRNMTTIRDEHFKASAFAKKEQQESKSTFCELFEIHGEFLVPSEANPIQEGYEEVIVTYSLEYDMIVKAIYNPYFGKARHLELIPYLVQSHEVEGQGVTEQTMQFQESASASHNQVIDAGTAANAGLIVCSSQASWGSDQEIYPGKKIVTENPKNDVHVVALSQPSPALGAAEQKATQYAEKRSGIGAYQLGQESPIVGSQATATGTTALISEGNIRFWVSIDDMRTAIENLLYLTLQQIQQFAVEGLKLPSGEVLQLPQGDIRSALGLRIAITSETMNRELEIRNIQMLVQMLNEYYMRIMQAAAVLQNPQFPPLQKMVIIQVMNSAHDLMKRLVERFDMENVETIVPNLMTTVAQQLGVLGGQTGMAGGAGQTAPGMAQGPAGGVPGADGQNGGPGAAPAPMGGGALPF